ncbi:MAG: AI-2E family transporter [Solirubrobacterales bacterium]
MNEHAAPAAASPPQPQRPWALLDFLAGLSWRFIVCFIALGIVVFVLIQLSFVVVPLLIAILVSSILAPVAERLRRRGWSSGLAATATIGIALAVLVGIALLTIPPLISNAGNFASTLKHSADELEQVLEGSPFNVNPTQAHALAEKLQDAGPKIEKALVSGLGTIVPLVGQAVVTMVLAIVMTGYMLRDGDRYWNWALGFVEDARRPAIDRLGQGAYGTLAAYLQGTSIVALFNTFFISLGAYLLGLPLILPIAIIIFVAAFLPIVGAWLAAFTAIAIALASQGVGAAIAMGLIYLLVSQFKSYFISPFVIGTRVNLPPIITLTSVMVGTVLGGVAGGILAVPLVATVSGTLSQIRKWRVDGEFAGVPAS